NEALDATLGAIAGPLAVDVEAHGIEYSRRHRDALTRYRRDLEFPFARLAAKRIRCRRSRLAGCRIGGICEQVRRELEDPLPADAPYEKAHFVTLGAEALLLVGHREYFVDR